MAKRRKPVSTKRTNKRRKGLLSVAFPWLKRFGLILGMLVLVTWIGAWLVLSGAAAQAVNWSKDQIVQASGSAGFTVDDLLVEGRVHADADFLLALINVQPGDPLFSLSPEATRTLLEETEWVRTAHVERRLPGTIFIKLIERVPTALWQDGDELNLVDEDGVTIKTDRLERFADLITVSGNGAEKEAFALVQLLQSEPVVFERARRADRVGQRRWDITLKSGLVLKLPEDADIGLALRRAAEAQKDEELLDSYRLQTLDLRMDDRVIVRNKPGMAHGDMKPRGEPIAAPHRKGEI